LVKIAKGHGQHEDGDEGLQRHLTRYGDHEVNRGIMNATYKERDFANTSPEESNGSNEVKM